MQATIGVQSFADGHDRAPLLALCRAWLVDLSDRARRRLAAIRPEDASGLDAHMRRDVGLSDFHC
jgi:hypothetical protein